MTRASASRVTQPELLDLAHVPQLTELLTACDIAVVGHADVSEDELVADLRDDSMEYYGWWDSDGRLVAHGYLDHVGASDKVVIDAYVHPEFPDHDFGLEVLRFMEGRGKARVTAAGKDSVLYDVGVYRQDERTQGWLRSLGYTSPTSFVRMRIDLDHPVDETAVDGVTVRRSDRSEDDMRAAYRVDAESFVEHYAHVHVDYETWLEKLTARGDDFAELWLADVDGEPAGLLVGTTRYLQEHNAGYVRTLGTLPAARGRGAGKALLRAYFASEQRAGRAAVLLHVDVANVTGALAIYESVGMRPMETIDAWAKRVPILDSDTPT